MTAEIRSAAGHGSLTMDADRASVDLSYTRSDGALSSIFDRADFLAAVEAECDVTVIENAGLPEVVVDREWIEVAGQTFATDAYARENARLNLQRYAAAVRWMDANPPVDEAQVEALAKDLFDARWPGADWNTRANPQQDDYRTMARTLLAAGWTKDGAK